MYIDHINMFNNKQDAAFVVSLIKAIFNFIKRILLDITSVILQSDNVRSYRNSIVPFFIYMLRISTGLFLSCYIYIDTEYGKGVVDGHFVKMMKIVRAYVDAVFNVCTPTQLGYKLN